MRVRPGARRSGSPRRRRERARRVRLVGRRPGRTVDRSGRDERRDEPGAADGLGRSRAVLRLGFRTRPRPSCDLAALRCRVEGGDDYVTVVGRAVVRARRLATGACAYDARIPLTGLGDCLNLIANGAFVGASGIAGLRLADFDLGIHPIAVRRGRPSRASSAGCAAVGRARRTLWAGWESNPDRRIKSPLLDLRATGPPPSVGGGIGTARGASGRPSPRRRGCPRAPDRSRGR
jgi:hypothetical protein